MPLYLFSPQTNNAFLYTGWNDQNSVCTLELRPLNSSLVLLRKMYDYILNCIVAKSTDQISFVQHLRAYEKVFCSSSLEVFYLLQVIELFMYLFNIQVINEFLANDEIQGEATTKTQATTDKPKQSEQEKEPKPEKTKPSEQEPKTSSDKGNKNENKSKNNGKINNVKLSTVKKLPKLYKLPYKQCRMYRNDLVKILYSVYTVNKPLVVLDYPELVRYFNVPAQIGYTKKCNEFILQTSPQTNGQSRTSFVTDLLQLNMLCLNLDENQVLNLLTQQNNINVFALVIECLCCFERQSLQLKLLQSTTPSSVESSVYDSEYQTKQHSSCIPRDILTSNNEHRTSFTNIDKFLH